MTKGISDRPTQRRLATAAQSALELVSDAVVVVDAAGVVLEANPAAASTFGASRRDLAGSEIERLLPGILQRTTVVDRQVVTARRIDGTTFPARVSVCTLEAENGRPFVATVTDLSEARAMESRLQAAQKMEAVGLLAGGIAHDFNNLLMIVAGYCESLRKAADLPDAQRTGLEQIAIAAEQATSLTAQLLALSRRAAVEPAIMDFHAALEQTRKLLDRTMGDDIAIAMELAAAPVHVRMNRSDVGQILINLAINARDAMPSGGTFTIRTTVVSIRPEVTRPDLTPGAYVELTVSDTGSGMAPETRARAFEPFFTTKSAGAGTGLGLASVARIVKAAGGEIHLESSPGAGTSFVILLPLQSASGTATEASDRQDLSLAGSETALVVEDEPAVREIVATMLRDLGYRTLEASGLSDAIAVAVADEGPIDILVSDMVMPDVDGAELARRLRQRLPALKVLFMSGYNDDEGPPGSEPSTAESFIRKPFTRLTLARKVREALHTQPTSPSSTS
jgi:two-component system cell cycle sensor histidine kinase/response regulator CckA